jgi:outer membrane lipoprotein-sorting protein
MKQSFGLSVRNGLLLVAMALFAANPAAAASPTTADTPSLTVEEIIARNVEARGGLERLRSIKTMKQTGRISEGEQRRALVTRERKRPGRMRLEFTLQGVTSVQVFDGHHGWRMSPLDGHLVPEPLPEEVEVEASEEADIDGPLIDWKAKGHKVEFAGSETIDGRETYKLKVTLKSGRMLHEYLDAETFTRVRSDSTRQIRGRTVQVTTTYADHRKTDGILFPHLIEVVAAGRPQRLRVVVDSIEINPPLSDERFEMWKDGE